MSPASVLTPYNRQHVEINPGTVQILPRLVRKWSTEVVLMCRHFGHTEICREFPWYTGLIRAPKPALTTKWQSKLLPQKISLPQSFKLVEEPTTRPFHQQLSLFLAWPAFLGSQPACYTFCTAIRIVPDPALRPDTTRLLLGRNKKNRHKCLFILINICRQA